jgi:UDP-2,3-diacylglucosamine pyrophosphatase LpxH
MVVKTIKQLDSRLNPSIYVPNNRDEMMQAVNDNKAISDFNG